MKKVISYCLYGTEPKYVVGALANASTRSIFYPDWLSRFYVDEAANEVAGETLRREGAEVCVMRTNLESPMIPMFWRLLVFDDPGISITIQRDCDSRFSWREVAAVTRWFSATGKMACSIHDHPAHTWPLGGGLWGCRTEPFRGRMGNLIMRWLSSQPAPREGEFRTEYNMDQRFLAEVIYPEIEPHVLHYDEFGLFKGADVIPYPVKDGHFVGEVYDENNKPRLEDRGSRGR